MSGRRRPRRALVVNAYSIGNWGDTAITEGLIQALRDAGYDEIAVAPTDWGRRPAGRTAAEPDTVVRPLVNLLDIPAPLLRVRAAALLWVMVRVARAYVGQIPEYRDADLVASVGGAFLGGRKAGANLIKVANIRAGMLAGRPTVLAPVSIYPFSPTVGRVLRWGLRGTTIYVRDQQSLEQLRSLGMEAVLAPDVAFRAPSLVASAARARLDRDPGRRSVIGWSPRSYRVDHRAWGDAERTEQIVLEAVQQVLATSDRTLRLIAHVRAGPSDDDGTAVERVLRSLAPAERARVEVAEEPRSLEEAVRRYRDLEVLITSRMHAAIFGLAVGTPSLAVAYEPKVHGVMALAGLQDRVIDVSPQLRPEDVVRRLEAMADPAERDRSVEAFETMRHALDDLPDDLARIGSA